MNVEIHDSLLLKMFCIPSQSRNVQFENKGLLLPIFKFIVKRCLSRSNKSLDFLLKGNHVEHKYLHVCFSYTVLTSRPNSFCISLALWLLFTHLYGEIAWGYFILMLHVPHSRFRRFTINGDIVSAEIIIGGRLNKSLRQAICIQICVLVCCPEGLK